MLLLDNGILFSVLKPEEPYILLSERNYSEKATYCITLTTWNTGKGKTMETVKKKLVVIRASMSACVWGEDELAGHSDL